MSSFRIISFSLRCLYVILALFFTASCSVEARRQEPDNLFWPPTPDTPKIKYIESIYSDDDIGREYSFTEKLFGKDFAIDTLARPYGVHANRDKIYVTDLTLRGVVVMDLLAKRFKLLGAEGALQVPSAVVADATGAIYIADAGGSKITVYDAHRAYRTAFLLPGSRPVALVLNEKLGRLYVVDRNTHQVMVLDREGKTLFAFGGVGDTDGKFNLPLGIAADNQGTLYVLDAGNFRVQIFDPDGKYISKFGAVGDRPGMLANPKGIAVDSEQHIYITDAAFSNLQIFDTQGRFLLNVGSLGPMPGQFHLPSGISIDGSDRIYVADQFNKRIEVFQYLKTPQ